MSRTAAKYSNCRSPGDHLRVPQEARKEWAEAIAGKAETADEARTELGQHGGELGRIDPEAVPPCPRSKLAAPRSRRPAESLGSGRFVKGEAAQGERHQGAAYPSREMWAGLTSYWHS